MNFCILILLLQFCSCAVTGMQRKYLESNSAIVWVKMPLDLLLPQDDPTYRSKVFVTRKQTDTPLSEIEFSKDKVALKNAVHRAYAARYVANEKEAVMEVSIFYILEMIHSFINQISFFIFRKRDRLA